MRAPRDGGRRRGARRGARAHAVSGQGGPGEGDACTDLGSNQFYNELYGGESNACDACLGPGGDAWPLDCATGNPSLPKIVECFQDDTIAAGDHCAPAARTL